MDLELIPASEWGIFPASRPMIIAGPCSAETESQTVETATALAALGVNVFRAGIWKPRTHPDSFEGVGTEGLRWLQRVGRETGMKVCTEVAGASHVRECLRHGIDMVWIGARTTANPFVVQEIADALRGADLPVLVKNPVNPDLGLWVGALVRLNRAGIRKLGVIHRGFSTAQPGKYRNDPGWRIAIELRTGCPGLPFFADPSHMGGDREYLRELSQRALDLGLDGLMIESHCDPGAALSDSGQQLTPAALGELLGKLAVRSSDSESLDYKENIGQLRAEIDDIDEKLLALLGARLDISREIGRYKKDHNIAILQTSRWENLLASMIEKGRSLGLSPEYVTAVFNTIHEASVQAQDDILSD